MLSAGRAHQQARHVWIALAWTGQAEASVSACRESSTRTLTATSGTHALAASTSDNSLLCASTASFSGRQLPLVTPACDGAQQPIADPADCAPSTSTSGRSFAAQTSGAPRGSWYKGHSSSVLLPPSVPASGAAGSAWTPLAGTAPLGCRSYHPWFYGSKLRNRAIVSTSSLDQLADMLRHEGSRLDHVNLAAFLHRLQLAAAAEAAAATTEAGRAAEAAPTAASTTTTTVATAVAASSSQAVERQVSQLAAEAARLVRKRAKWYDPRYAALVVSRTAALRYTDGRMLHELTGRMLARLNEAYSRDLLLLLRGLHAHMKLTAAAADPAAEQAQRQQHREQRPLVPGQGRRRQPAPPLPYGGPPAVLMAGVETFLLAKLPTGRMPPENIDGLLRYCRALSGRPAGPRLCAAAAEDLSRRLVIYAPAPLAGVLSTLASERHPLPPDLLAGAADQFAAHAGEHGSGAAAARFLAAAAAVLRNHQKPQPRAAGEEASPPTSSPSSPAAPVAEGPAKWIAARPDLLAQCLKLMTKDLPVTPPERLGQWLQALARIQAPVAGLSAAAAATAAASGGGSAAAAAAAVGFVRAHSAAVERALPGLAAGSVTRLRKAYDAVRLPYPKGL